MRISDWSPDVCSSDLRHQQNHDRLDAGDQCGRDLRMGIEPVEHAQPPVTVATTPSARNGMPAKPAGRPIVPCGKLSLILAVAVPERELRQVAPGERRLLAGDRVQCDFWPGDDLLAVLARDPGMVLAPLGLTPLFGHPRPRARNSVVKGKR